MEYIIPAASAIVVAVKTFNHAKFSLQNVERSLLGVETEESV